MSFKCSFTFSTVTFLGVQPKLISIEVDINKGLPNFEILGLAHTAIREGRIRILAALKALGFEIGHRKVTVNLSPADIKKEGTHFDLPITLAILESMGVIGAGAGRYFAMGELGLDGSLHRVRGVLMALDFAQKNGHQHFVRIFLQ